MYGESFTSPLPLSRALARSLLAASPKASGFGFLVANPHYISRFFFQEGAPKPTKNAPFDRPLLDERCWRGAGEVLERCWRGACLHACMHVSCRPGCKQSSKFCATRRYILPILGARCWRGAGEVLERSFRRIDCKKLL